MTSHVAESACAKIKPTAPDKRVINGALGAPAGVRRLVFGPFCFERPHGGGSEPIVPFEAGRDWVLAGRAGDALRPDWAIRPDMDLFDRTNEAGLHEFDRAAEAVFGTALVAHLGDDFI